MITLESSKSILLSPIYLGKKSLLRLQGGMMNKEKNRSEFKTKELKWWCLSDLWSIKYRLLWFSPDYICQMLTLEEESLWSSRSKPIGEWLICKDRNLVFPPFWTLNANKLHAFLIHMPCHVCLFTDFFFQFEEVWKNQFPTKSPSDWSGIF